MTTREYCLWAMFALALIGVAGFVAFFPIPAAVPPMETKESIGVYKSLAPSELGEAINMMVTWALGLCAVMAFFAKEGATQKGSLPVSSLLFVLAFVLFVSLSLYYAAQTRLALVLQLEAGIFSYERLEEPLFRQAIFLILASLFALLMLWVRVVKQTKENGGI